MPAQPGSLGVNLPVGNVTETEVVTAAPLVVDVTSAVVAEAITLDLTSGRSYQSCPWLVPGVLSEDADAPGNPASKSGLNHRDIGGEAGVSRDIVYYIDSINVTDGVSRTFGANFNTEIRPTPRRANLTRTISVTSCGGWLCPRSVKWWTGCPGGEKVNRPGSGGVLLRRVPDPSPSSVEQLEHQPECSAASDEPAHGVHATAGNVLPKRPDWEA